MGPQYVISHAYLLKGGRNETFYYLVLSHGQALGILNFFSCTDRAHNLFTLQSVALGHAPFPLLRENVWVLRLCGGKVLTVSQGVVWRVSPSGNYP